MHALFVLALLTSGLPRDRGLETPVHDVTAKGAPSEGIEGAHVRVRCAVYSTFAVVEHNDPGLRGAPHVEVRDRTGDDSVDTLCSDAAAQKARRVVVEDAYFMGVVGPHLVFRGADGFGLEHRLIVVGARPGATALDLRATGREAQFSSQDGVFSLAFELVVASECTDPALCLADERARGAIAKDTVLTLAKTGCRRRQDDESLLQVAVPARVSDLSKPAVRVVDGIVRCGATP